MRTTTLFAAVLVLAGAGAAGAQGAAKGEAEARRVLVEMTQRIAGLREFTVEARRHMDPALTPGMEAAEDARIEVQVQRPDKLHATIRAGKDVRHVFYDGATLTVLDEAKNVYAQTPVKGTIDDMVRHLDERFGFTPPLAELVTNDPHSFIRDQVKTARLGEARAIDGRQCRRLDLAGDLARADLWVAEDGRLPCRLEATFTGIEGAPKLNVEFGKWTVDADIPDSAFVFRPPEGARKIKMAPVEGPDGT
jgi:hypothetical protein